MTHHCRGRQKGDPQGLHTKEGPITSLSSTASSQTQVTPISVSSRPPMSGMGSNAKQACFTRWQTMPVTKSPLIAVEVPPPWLSASP